METEIFEEEYREINKDLREGNMENEKIFEHIRTFIRMRPEIIEDQTQEEFYLTSSNDISSSSITEYQKTGKCSYFSQLLKKDYQFKFDGFFDGDVTQAEVIITVAIYFLICL